MPPVSVLVMMSDAASDDADGCDDEPRASSAAVPRAWPYRYPVSTMFFLHGQVKQNRQRGI